MLQADGISHLNAFRRSLLQSLRLTIHRPHSKNNEAITSDSEWSENVDAMYLAIDCPNLNDVIFRGKHACLSHPGNVMFRGLIEAKYDEHNNATTIDEKVQLTWDIVREVESKNGRFLVWDNNGCWREITNRNRTRTKVAGALKDHKRRLKARQNVAVNYSSTYEFERQDNENKKRKVDVKHQTSDCCLNLPFVNSDKR